MPAARSELDFGLISRVVVKVDLHVHSSASADCNSEPESVAVRCRRLGLHPVFLTDHNTLAGVHRLRALGEERIVAGEEIMTAAGEIIGLFLKRTVPTGMTPKDTALDIKLQGGLVYLEHPYDPFRRHLSEESIEALSELIDIVEVFNGRSDERTNRRALDLCTILDAAPGAGSDAHSLGEIGSVYLEMEDFAGPEDFLVKLRAATIVKRRRSLILSASETIIRNLRRRA